MRRYDEPSRVVVFSEFLAENAIAALEEWGIEIPSSEKLKRHLISSFYPLIKDLCEREQASYNAGYERGQKDSEK